MSDLYVEFSSRVETADNGCVLWVAGVHKVGYGALYVKKWGDTYAHRWSYKYHHGDIPKGKVVRHKCDNKLCVNPDHLELGNQQDNIDDMWKRNPDAGNRKVSDEQVRIVFEMNEKGATKKQIAEAVKVSREHIYRILNKDTAYQKFTTQ